MHACVTCCTRSMRGHPRSPLNEAKQGRFVCFQEGCTVTMKGTSKRGQAVTSMQPGLPDPATPRTKESTLSFCHMREGNQTSTCRQTSACSAPPHAPRNTVRRKLHTGTLPRQGSAAAARTSLLRLCWAPERKSPGVGRHMHTHTRRYAHSWPLELPAHHPQTAAAGQAAGWPGLQHPGRAGASAKE